MSQVIKKKSAIKSSKNLILAPKSALAPILEETIQYHSAGNWHLAKQSCKKALAIDPSNDVANLVLGQLAHKAGENDYAVELINRSLQENPTRAETHFVLGNIFSTLKDYQQAISAYEKAVELNTDYTAAFQELGCLYFQEGKLKEAIKNLRNLKSVPGFAKGFYVLGKAFQKQNEPVDALYSMHFAVKLDPNFSEAIKEFATMLTRYNGCSDEKLNRSLNKACAIALQSGHVENQTIFPLLVRKKIENVQTTLMQFYRQKSHQKRWQLLLEDPDLKNFLNDEFILAFLKTCVLCNKHMELFLTSFRETILTQLSKNNFDFNPVRHLVPLISAVAHQCFFNEYILLENDQELSFLPKLISKTRASIKINDALFQVGFSLLGCYQPIKSLNLLTELSNQPVFVCKNSFFELVKIQIEEPAIEEFLKTTISQLSELHNKTSIEVQQQYEENPYPRWVDASFLTEKKYVLTEIIKSTVTPNDYSHIKKIKNPKILVAGCGTGRHPLDRAHHIENASVLAIDLSKSSLAYAKRKAVELDIKNIDFLQADILDLDQLDDQFDVVESVGVLHHMQNPMAGWKILKSRLKPGGYMLIGLYSEIARQGVVQVRELIAEKGYQPTAQDIRQCRHDLYHLPQEHIASHMKFGVDFFTMSSARDLLFHCQEHRFTVPQLKDCIDELDMEFMGMNSANQTLWKEFLVQHGNQKNTNTLKNWEAFEKEHPKTFFGMYHFWLRKKEA